MEQCARWELNVNKMSYCSRHDVLVSVPELGGGGMSVFVARVIDNPGSFA